MSAIGAVHFTFSLLAIVLGAVTLRLRKGDRWHRTWGHGYVWSMLGVVATSFAMYDLTGRVTPFHIAAIVAGLTILAGMWSVLARRPSHEWISAHATWMAWSYVGLMAAFAAESLTRFIMPALEDDLTRRALWPAFWILVGVGSFATGAFGAWLIRRRLGPAISQVTGVTPDPTAPIGPAGG